MKYTLSRRQVHIMQELYQLGVSPARIREVSGISYSQVRAVLKNGRSTALKPIKREQKASLEDIIRKEKREHPAFKALFSERKDIEKIFRTKDGIEKIVTLAAASGWLDEHSFTASHCYKIVRAGREWRAKLEWIIQNYQNILQPLGFNGYHVAQIVTNAGWDKKLDWIAENYQNILQPLGFNGSHVAQIVTNAGWDKKLNWIAENYQQFLEYGLTPGRVAFFFNAENWETLATHWTASVKSLPGLDVSDEQISPLTEQYLLRLTFEGMSITEVSALRAKCTAEAVDEFAEQVQRLSLSGANGTKNLPEVMDNLQQHGYSELEVELYLKAMNKNKRGLVRWYNTGEKYAALPTVVFDDSRGYPQEHAASPVDIVDRKMTLQKYIERAAATEQEKKFWERVIVEYDGDIEMLNQQERDTFQKLTRKMRKDRPLMAELYDLLKG